MIARRLSVLVALLSLAACNSASSSEPEFDYDGDDLREAIEGTWEGTSNGDAAATPVTLTLVYASPDAHTLCGNRMLALGEPTLAPRCMDYSTMNVTGSLATERDVESFPRTSPEAFRGSFVVYSLRFDGRGELDGQLDGARLSAVLSNDVLEGSVTGDGKQLEFSLRRRR
jgi:hypothetical protein